MQCDWWISIHFLFHGSLVADEITCLIDGTKKIAIVSWVVNIRFRVLVKGAIIPIQETFATKLVLERSVDLRNKILPPKTYLILSAVKAFGGTRVHAYQMFFLRCHRATGQIHSGQTYDACAVAAMILKEKKRQM